MENQHKNKKRFYKTRFVEINTDEAKQVLSKFEYLSSALYFIYVKAPFFYSEEFTKNRKKDDFVLTEKGLYELYQYVGDKLVNCAQSLSKETGRLNDIIIEKDSDVGSISYNSVKEHAKIYAPIANNFLSIIVDLDKLIVMNDLLWFDGHISDKERNSNIAYYKKFIFKNFQNIIKISSDLKGNIYSNGKK